MFTGLIEERGEILEVTEHGSGIDLLIRAAQVLEDLAVDDSIAVDGCCQTVTQFDDETFTVTSIEETLKKTTFGSFVPGRQVNLERALRVGDRLGGHFVQGHVDTTGSLRDIEERDGSWLFRFACPVDYHALLIPVGSITVNGVSLTVAEFDDEGFTVAIIPHTYNGTTFGSLKTGDDVNLEFDMIGKYIRRLAEQGRPSSPGTIADQLGV